jgi:hypothetical protein
MGAWCEKPDIQGSLPVVGRFPPSGVRPERHRFVKKARPSRRQKLNASAVTGEIVKLLTGPPLLLLLLLHVDLRALLFPFSPRLYSLPWCEVGAGRPSRLLRHVSPARRFVARRRRQGRTRRQEPAPRSRRQAC